MTESRSVPSSGGSAVAAPAGLTLRREITRKSLHLLSISVPGVYAVGLSRDVVVALLMCALAVAIGVEIARREHARSRALFDLHVGMLLRSHEALGISGATWLVLALLSSAVLFPPVIAIAAMCAVALGDAAAAIVGRTLSRGVRAPSKTIAGTVACFAASALAAGFIAQLTPGEAVLAGILAALAERPRYPFDDNLRIALVVGCGILLWRMGFS